jgi:hypothetical protein
MQIFTEKRIQLPKCRQYCKNHDKNKWRKSGLDHKIKYKDPKIGKWLEWSAISEPLESAIERNVTMIENLIERSSLTSPNLNLIWVPESFFERFYMNGPRAHQNPSNLAIWFIITYHKRFCKILVLSKMNRLIT